MWDPSMGADGSQGRETRALMSKAFAGALQAAQQQQLLALLEADPKARARARAHVHSTIILNFPIFSFRFRARAVDARAAQCRSR